MNETTASPQDKIRTLMTGYDKACVVGAACELGIFSHIGAAGVSVQKLAQSLSLDARALRYLLDALCSLEFLTKEEDRYHPIEGLTELLDERHARSMAPMILHQMHIMRHWCELSRVVQSGKPWKKGSTIRGPEADRKAFIAAMHTVSEAAADGVIARFCEAFPGSPTHILDVGGASGTWTLAFLRRLPKLKATLFDLPDAIVQARERLMSGPFAQRVQLAGGDFYQDLLPQGADLGWVSAIIHQHDKEHNRALYSKVFAALAPGGSIAIRDFVMEPSHTCPTAGAMFAINMLVGTETGGTFSFDEIAADLQAAGFRDPVWLVKDPTMNSIVTARKD